MDSDLILFVVLIVSLEFTHMGLDQRIHVVSLTAHFISCEVLAALRAFDLVIEPVQDALVVESVTHITGKRSDLVSAAEVSKAD